LAYFFLPDVTEALTYTINKDLHGHNITGQLNFKSFAYTKETVVHGKEVKK